MTTCIYCKREKTSKQFSKEHIIPEALGYTDKLYKTVCIDCNNELSNIDEMISQYGKIGLMKVYHKKPPKRKKNKKNRLPIFDDNKIKMSLKQDNYIQVEKNYKIYLKFQDGEEYNLSVINGIYKNEDKIKKVISKQQEVPIIDAKAEILNAQPKDIYKYNRGIHKIGFSIFIKEFGKDKVFLPEFDYIRRYIRYDNKDERKFLLGMNHKYNNIYSIFWQPGGECIVRFCINSVKLTLSLMRSYSVIKDIQRGRIPVYSSKPLPIIKNGILKSKRILLK